MMCDCYHGGVTVVRESTSPQEGEQVIIKKSQSWEVLR